MLTLPRDVAPGLLGYLLFACALGAGTAGCQASRVKSPDMPSGPGGAGGPGGGPDLTLPDGGAADTSLSPQPPGSGEQCLEEVIAGELIPLDLMLVLDGSGSMRVMVGGKTRWQQVSEALAAFVRDPRSTGLGVGVQVFPFTIYQKPCTRDSDCDDSPITGPPGFLCARPFLCSGPGVELETARTCDPNDPYCPEAGTRCGASGRCAISGARCLNLGQACPGGSAGDTCAQAPTVCNRQIDSCLESDYTTPRVAIGPLPAAAGNVVQGLAAVTPGGNTPIAPALAGAAKHLREYLAAHPGHRGALVLASDVSPSGCRNDGVEDVAATMEAARAASPSVTTYVIGAVSAGDMIRGSRAARLAQAGGTGSPFILNDSAADLGNRFLEALSAIRGSALACEFRIPKPRSGVIDPGRVNVRYVSSAGQEDLVYVGSAAGCQGSKGGWFYDVNPTSSVPTTVQVCPDTCARFKAKAGGAVELRFGCRTRID